MTVEVEETLWGGSLTLHSVTKIPTGTHISGRVNSTKARVPVMAGWTSKK